MAEKRLRCGYTTGSCAAAASHAAVEMLLGGDDVEERQKGSGCAWRSNRSAVNRILFPVRSEKTEGTIRM